MVKLFGSKAWIIRNKKKMNNTKNKYKLIQFIHFFFVWKLKHGQSILINDMNTPSLLTEIMRAMLVYYFM